MPRPRSPEGKHVTMSARFTEAEAAAIDAACAGLTRGEWLRRVALAGVRRTQAAVRAQLEIERRTPAPAEHSALHAQCRHPNLRMAKGVCPDCNTYVASKP